MNEWFDVERSCLNLLEYKYGRRGLPLLLFCLLSEMSTLVSFTFINRDMCLELNKEVKYWTYLTLRNFEVRNLTCSQLDLLSQSKLLNSDELTIAPGISLFQTSSRYFDFFLILAITSQK